MNLVFIQITPTYSGNVCRGKISALSQVFFFFFPVINPTLYFEQIDVRHKLMMVFGFRSAK